MTDSNIQPLHTFDDGAKLYRRDGVISVEDKDGNMLDVSLVSQYARQFMNLQMAKIEATQKTPTSLPEVTPLFKEGAHSALTAACRKVTGYSTADACRAEEEASIHRLQEVKVLDYDGYKFGKETSEVVGDTFPMDWATAKKMTEGMVRHQTLITTMPEVAPARVMDGVTPGIEPIREITNVKIEDPLLDVMSTEDKRHFLANLASVSKDLPVLVGDHGLSKKSQVMNEPMKDVDPSKVMVIGAGAGGGYGLKAATAAVLANPPGVTLVDEESVQIGNKTRPGTVGHAGFSPVLSRRIGPGLLAAAAAAATLTPSYPDTPAGLAQLQYDQRLESLKRRLRMLFEPEDRKEAKRVFATFRAGSDFGNIMHVTVDVPKGVFFGGGAGTADGKEIIRWIGKLVNSGDMTSLSRLIGGSVGYDVPWSWKLFSALVGRLLWDMVQKTPQLAENYDKLTNAERLMIMEQSIDQIVQAARSKPRKK